MDSIIFVRCKATRVGKVPSTSFTLDTKPFTIAYPLNVYEYLFLVLLTDMPTVIVVCEKKSIAL